MRIIIPILLVICLFACSKTNTPEPEKKQEEVIKDYFKVSITCESCIVIYDKRYTTSMTDTTHLYYVDISPNINRYKLEMTKKGRANVVVTKVGKPKTSSIYHVENYDSTLSYAECWFGRGD